MRGTSRKEGEKSYSATNDHHSAHTKTQHVSTRHCECNTKQRRGGDGRRTDTGRAWRFMEYSIVWFDIYPWSGNEWFWCSVRIYTLSKAESANY